MTRHLLVGRFGHTDTAPVPPGIYETPHELDLVASKRRFGHGIGDALDLLNKQSLFPSETGFDLLALAAMVHAADTRISRSTESEDSWTREFRIALPVSDLALWISATPTLVKTLNFLTGDLWSFTFRARPTDFQHIVPARPLAPKPVAFDKLSLFSGGLDSLVGAVDLLEQGHTPLLVSHAGEGAISDAQTTCFEALRKQYPQRRFARFRVWLNFPKTLIPGIASEDTTRGRSFLFFALAAFAGSGLARPFSITVPENGFIALNVPLDPLRLGSCSTRTTHPFYMARWNELLKALRIPGEVANPYWDQTKGEMVAGCKNMPLLKQLAAKSLSCASPTKGRWQRRGIEHCGYCVPCIIRRSALQHAFGRGNDPTSYTIDDLVARPLDTQKSEGQQIRSFQFALRRLLQRPALAKILIHKTGSLSDESGRITAYADVYRRGLLEVGMLLSEVQTQPT